MGLARGGVSRCAGSFRTHGLLVPVFDLDVAKQAEHWYDGLDQFDAWLVAAMADTAAVSYTHLTLPTIYAV